MCFPSPYLRSVSDLLLEQGILDTHLHVEEFVPGGVVLAQPGARPSLLAPRPAMVPALPQQGLMAPNLPQGLVLKAPPSVSIS